MTKYRMEVTKNTQISAQFLNGENGFYSNVYIDLSKKQT